MMSGATFLAPGIIFACLTLGALSQVYHRDLHSKMSNYDHYVKVKEAAILRTVNPESYPYALRNGGRAPPPRNRKIPWFIHHF